MRNTNRTVLLVLIALLIASPANAVGKTTVDPNAPGARPDAVEQTDARLAQKITYEAVREPVRDILADLSKLSGVTLKAGYNKQDWQVRDRRMNVFLKDTTLAGVMNSIANVMKFKWSKNDDVAPPTYRLYMDRKSVLAEEMLRQSQEDSYAERMSKKRDKAFAECKRVSDLSGEEIAGLRAENPYLHMMAVSGQASICGLFAGNSTATGQAAEINSADLSQADQQKLLRAVDDCRRFYAAIMPGPIDAPRPALEPVRGPLSLRVSDIPATSEWGGREDRVGFISIIQDGKTLTDLSLVDPASNFAKAVGKSYVRAWEEKLPEAKVWKAMADDVAAALAADKRANDSGDPLADHPDDARLHIDVKLMIEKGNSLNKIQPQLTEPTGLGVVSDNFNSRDTVSGLSGEPMELEDVLDKTADATAYNWWLHGPVIEFRDRHWFRKRAAQIPDEWLDRWRDTFKKTGTLDLGDLAQICTLTPEQWTVNINSDEVLGQIRSSRLFNFRSLTQIYAFLSDGERFAAMSKSGLDLKTVDPDNCLRIYKQLGSEYTRNPDAEMKLLIDRFPNGKCFRYDLKITTSDDLPAIKWSVDTPQYRELPMEPQKPEQQKGTK